MREAAFLAGDFSHPAGEPRGRLWPRLFECTDRAPDRLLCPGDRIGSLEVVDAVGHTPGQIALLDTRDRSLIAGDAFSTVAGVATTTQARLMSPFPALLGTWHAETALKTARRLIELRPSCLATGHGPAVADPSEPMKAALTRARKSRRWGSQT